MAGPTEPSGAAPLRAWLAGAARRSVTVAELAARWRMARIAVRCAGAGRLAHTPSAAAKTAAKLRGGWGRRLAEGASEGALAGGPCDWAAPCAYDLFFNPQGRLTGRLEIPKPFVLDLSEAEGDLLVELTLFGIAADWAGEAADALVRALRTGLDSAGDRRQALRPLTREIGVSEGLDPAPDGVPLMLEFLTPLALRQGAEVHADPASLILSLGNRVAGLALWHGAALEIDGPALAAEAQALGALALWRLSERPEWQRGSQAQGRRMMLEGVTGRLVLPPASALVAGLVSLGEQAHAGARTSLGLGRYRLAVLAGERRQGGPG